MPQHIITNPAAIPAQWRVAMSILGNLFLTMQRSMATTLSLGPTELLIFMTVAVANVQKLMRERSIAPDHRGTGVLPRE